MAEPFVQKMEMTLKDVLDAAKAIDGYTEFMLRLALENRDVTPYSRSHIARAIAQADKLLLQPALVESFDLFGVKCNLERALERHDQLIKEMMASATPCPSCGHPGIRLLVDEDAYCNKCHRKTPRWHYYGDVWVKKNPWPIKDAE